MTDDDVERAAEAAWKAETNEFGNALSWDKLDENYRAPRRVCMRAALATLPTQADAYRKAAGVARDAMNDVDSPYEGAFTALESVARAIEALATEGEG